MGQRTSLLTLATVAILGAVVSAMTFEQSRADSEGDGSATAAESSTVTRVDDRSLVGSVMTAIGLEAERKPQQLVLEAPENPELLIHASPFVEPRVPKGHIRAHAYQYESRVFRRPGKRPRAIGLVRRGIVLEGDGIVKGPGCKGAWYTLTKSRGVVCSRDGFAMSTKRREWDFTQRIPAVDKPVPFQYAKATDGAPRFYDVPSAEELESAIDPERSGRGPDVLERAMDGVYLLALDELDSSGEFYRTVRGRYVRVSDVELKEEPAMRGELLNADMALPIAFVYGEEDAPVYGKAETSVEEVGLAKKHARFPLATEQAWNERAMGVSPGGFAVPRERLRIARATKRPAGIPSTAKWIHIDLDEQTLVAYEGKMPVFATLVSTGLDDGFATPTGLFQVREKHISVTMNGPDPDNGFYEVEEVPWTMYYHDSYAMHGAYWHNTFGNTRSHGCTNLSPIDARFLFYWSDKALPKGWHALRQLKGTWVYLTRAEKT